MRTRKAYQRMLKIWAGATWSDFIRHSLIKRRTSKVLTFINNVRVSIARKKQDKIVNNFNKKVDPIHAPNVFDVPDLRDLKVKKPKTKKNFKLPLKTNNWKLSRRKATNQFQTMRCSAYGTETGKGIMDSLEVGRAIYHDPSELWNHQLKTGASEKHGDTIQNACKQLNKHGFYTNKRHYTITEYRKLADKSVKTLMKWIALRKTIVTGIFVRKDKGYGTNYARASFHRKGTLVISRGQKIGGHLQVIVDYETREDGVWFFLPNTYGEEWGNADGGGWIHESEIKYTMSKYILFDTRDDFNV